MSNFRKMHWITVLVIVLTVATVMSGCVTNPKNETKVTDEKQVSVQIDTEDKDEDNEISVRTESNEEIYKLFLENAVNVNIDNDKYSLTQYVEEKGASSMKFEYAFFDMNDDGLNEFHFRSPRSYDIFTVNDGEIELWYEGSPYEIFTSDGNILYCRYGGAPVNNEYIFKELDFDGNVVSEVSWSVYNLDNNRHMTEDTVFYNGKGAEITKDEYYNYINKYNTVPYDYNWFVFYDNLRTVTWNDIDEETKTNITIQYPAVFGMQDLELQKRINFTIKEAAFERYNDYSSDLFKDGFDNTSWPVDYTVAHYGDRFISIYFEGYIYTMGYAHGSDTCWTVNVDLSTGERIKLGDVFEDTFCEYITFENFGNGAFTDAEAFEKLFGTDKEYLEADFTSESNDNFFFGDNDLGIKLYMYSDYYNYFIADYESLTPCMKDHPIWQELGVQNPNNEDFSLNYNGFTFNCDTTIDEITSFFPTSERWEEPQNYLFIAGCPTSRRISLNYPDGHNPEISIICIENLETGESFIERIIIYNDDTVKVTGGKYINAFETVLGEHIYEFKLHVDLPESHHIDLYQKSLTGEAVSSLPFDGKINLLYASGAGAWGDYITLSADGSYTRNFHDVNMGITGEENPNGTVDFDNETGKFELLKLDDYTYMLTIKESTHEYRYSEEWIEDGVKYISTAPEYSDVGTIYILALPGKPIQEIPISVMEWDLDRFFGYVTESTLTYYALYPYSGGIGYFAYEHLNDEADEEIPRYP